MGQARIISDTQWLSILSSYLDKNVILNEANNQSFTLS